MVDAKARASRLRQAIRRTELDRARQLKRLTEERGPLIQGSFVLQAGRCGKPSCRCTRGEPHPRATLYVSEQGARRGSYVPQADRERVERLNRRERGYREARVALAKLAQKTLELVDALHEVLTEPYPPAGRRTGKARQKEKREPERRKRGLPS